MRLSRHPALCVALPLLALAACAEPVPAPVVAASPAEPAVVPAVATATPPRPTTRMPTTFGQPVALSRREPGWSPLAEPAPVPNRAIEAPRNRLAESLNPTLEPMMMPPERRQGTTFGGEHLRETGPDRPLDNFVPGARLRIPFESEPRR